MRQPRLDYQYCIALGTLALSMKASLIPVLTQQKIGSLISGFFATGNTPHSG
jgi:hypothetical protein